jgi:hypothetical protein
MLTLDPSQPWRTIERYGSPKCLFIAATIETSQLPDFAKVFKQLGCLRRGGKSALADKG